MCRGGHFVCASVTAVQPFVIVRFVSVRRSVASNLVLFLMPSQGVVSGDTWWFPLCNLNSRILIIRTPK